MCHYPQSPKTVFIRVNRCLKNEIGPFVPQCLCGHESIMQNKPNVKMGNMNISIVATKPYPNESASGGNNEQQTPFKTNPIKPNSPCPPPAPGKNPESRSETHIPIYRASIKDREFSIENSVSRIQYRESSIFPILP